MTTGSKNQNKTDKHIRHRRNISIGMEALVSCDGMCMKSDLQRWLCQS